MFKDFKAFVMRGNVVDLAVAVIIGAAFGKIVSSFVNDVVMPPIGRLMGGVDFSNLFVLLSSDPKFAAVDSLQKAKELGAPTLNYGVFLNTLIDFVIVAFVIFALIRIMSKMHKEKAAAPAELATKECPQCCSTIAIKAKRCPNCTSQL
jgi:large conductance mechanosensitive channel